MTLNINTDIVARKLGRRLIIGGRPYIAGVVLHDTAGSGTHNDTRYLANPSDGRVVSVDFTVERDGSVYQLNPDLVNNCAWHAGRATRFRNPVDGRVLRNGEVTRSMIGIEIVQKADLSLSPTWPDAQVEAVGELCAWLCGKFGLRKEQITTHQAIITDGSRTDPRRWPFDLFWTFFNRAAGSPATDPRPETASVGQPTFYVVQKGDSLWKIANKYSTTIETLKANNQIVTASNIIYPGQRLLIRK